MLVQLALALVLLSVCSFTPGFFFIRRLPWTPLEKLCGSLGLSLLLLYLAMWANFGVGPHNTRIGCWLIAGGAVALGALAWQDALRLLASFRVNQSVRWFGVLLAWTLVSLAIIRVYSGAGWSGDWKEHFHRTLFFLNRLPLDTPIFPDLALTARPPLMNVLAAYFLGLTADRFEIFQVVFAFLNLLLFFPCVLILPALGGRHKRAVVPLAVLFAASPVVMESATYSWTKAFAAFYVVLALSLYVAGIRKNSQTRISSAFLALTAGFLAHYSAGPYLVLLSLHYFVYVVRRREWRHAAATAIACGLLLATWFGWSAAVYGWRGTVATNSSVGGIQEHQGSNAAKIADNLVDTLVPVWMREGYPHFRGAAGEPAARDKAFLFYQLNLVFAMGVVGGPFIVWLWLRTVFRKGAGWERWFWRIMVPACIVIGVAVVGERDPKGVPHLTLLSIEVLGLSLLAANFFSLPRIARFLLIAGCAADIYAGIWLQARVENLENTPDRVLFDDIQYKPLGSPDTVSEDTYNNWALKWKCRIAKRQLASFPVVYGNRPSFQKLWPQVQAEFEKPLHEDEQRWGGWASRHGGVLSYLGDWVAGESGRGSVVPEVVFALIAIGLLGVLLRTALASNAIAAPAPAKAVVADSRKPKRRARTGR